MDAMNWTFSGNGRQLLNLTQVEMITFRQAQAYDGATLTRYFIDARTRSGRTINILSTDSHERAATEYTRIGRKLGAYAIVNGESQDGYGQSAKEIAI